MAENAWYEKHKKDVAAALKKAKAAPKEEALSCSLVKMSDASHVVCIHINAGKAMAIVKEAKAGGGKVVSAGRLYLDGDKPTFEVDVGDLTVKPKFALAAAAVGVPMNVIVKGADGPPVAPPAPGEAVPAPPAPPDFKTRVTGLATAVKAAAKEVQAAVQPDLMQALTLGKAGKFADAEPHLLRVEQGLARAAAPPTPPKAPPAPPPRAPGPEKQTPPPAPPPPSAAAQGADKNVLKDRLQAIKPRYLEAIKANPPNKPVLEKAMGLLVQTVKSGDVAKGLKILDGLEKTLGAAPAGDFTARFAASRERWLTAREKAGDGISSLQAALRRDGDPRFQRVGEMGLNGISGRVQVGLEVALREVQSDPARRDKARQAVADFRQFISTDPVVGLCDDNPYGVAVGLRATLLPALEDLEKSLLG